MKSGISLFSFTETTDYRWAFSHAARAGYDGVEPVMSEGGYLTPKTSEKDILAIRKAAENEGLEIPSVGVWSLWENNLVSDDPAVRTKARDIVRAQIEAASLLGAHGILVVPGYVGCEFASHPEVIPYDAAYDRALEAFSYLEPYARAAGVRIGIENVWNRFLLSPLEMKSFIDTIGSRYVGVYLDVGNVIYTGYPEHWINILGERIVLIHLSDFRRSQAGVGGFVDLFAGDVDFPAVAKALAAIGYDDYLTLEMLPNYRQFPEVSLYADKYAVDKIMEMAVEAKK